MNPELIEQLTARQPEIWASVTQAVREATQKELDFTPALTVASKVADLRSELTNNCLALQFAFSDIPDHLQTIVIPQATVLEIASLIRGEPVEDADEEAVASVRPGCEAIVQGICLSLGALLGDPVVAAGMSSRFQEVAFPPNLQSLHELARCQVSVTGPDVNGLAIWLMDTTTAAFVCGIAARQGGLQPSSEGTMPGRSDASALDGDAEHQILGGMDLLYDIPLEISVELGRVKMLVKDVLELGTGSLVEIEKAAGEPVDVLVNGRLVAKGEVVVIEDNFGVRITEIVSPSERVDRLVEVA
jgi:flagellar motor switch protein FliN/FliY